MNSTLRLFAAVPLPDYLKESLGGWISGVKNSVPFRKWVHPQDLHITLQFLGEVEGARTPSIEKALETAAARSRSFRLQLGHSGTFGRASSPSILWVGLDGSLEELRFLQKQVEGAMTDVGFQAEERKFKPHVTVARTYQGQAGWDQTELSRHPLPEACLIPWQADRLVLYQSRLGARPMYEPVSSFSLSSVE
ncbi:2'-5' RNA ligase [Paenibacillus mucilaginosus 3016]|uniref:RNA 2',3'-cyclic phosphodiesterase n=2 Tax=Paenibacillus mucilaginosus TaxID=61624 RepID=H6NE11_9BACL|nr:RNA 2',3'-cyclic phosphodiesterase [Paenibacillus mucilaginosus]AFC32964.1 2'-5' RNA ligase [Paenibacillus mucilaginosus 3016]AFH65275.1 2'-5' RNA ligase [Paenibacillus mucilaginosus K02]WFA21409.1 RNA 2',3'-cyclic phosphodiesterase [Paenibacillus mucilaginosus]